MEVEKAKRNHFCFSSTFLLVLGIVTFTIAVFEGIGGAILWNHYESELQGFRERLDALENTPSIQDNGNHSKWHIHLHNPNTPVSYTHLTLPTNREV